MKGIANRNGRPGGWGVGVRPLALLVTAAAISGAWPDAALSQGSPCRISLQNIPRIEPEQGVYDPFERTQLPNEHRFEVRHSGGRGCTFAIGADAGRNGDRQMETGGERLGYELYVDPTLSQPLTDLFGASDGLIVARLEGGNDRSVDLSFYSVIPAGQIVSDGVYRDRVRFTVYEVENGEPGRILDTRNVNARAQVRQSVMAIVDLGAGAVPLTGGVVGTLDLGELSGGVVRGFSLEVQGNAAYSLSLASENRGELRREGGTGAIPYTLAVDGATLGLGSPASLPMGGGGGQRRHQLTLTVPPATRALAGTYSDNLVVTVSAN